MSSPSGPPSGPPSGRGLQVVESGPNCLTCNGRWWNARSGKWVRQRRTEGMVCPDCGTDYGPDSDSTGRTGAEMAIKAATVAGNLGDVLGGLHDECVATGRLAGRVETLLWCQAELQLELDRLRITDRFADTRQLEDFLVRVQDSLVRVQDGTGAWAGLVRTDVGTLDTVGPSVEGAPSVDMGG